MKGQRLLVIDSSIAVKWLISKDELHIPHAIKILEDTKEGFVKLLMPELARYEIGNVLVNKKFRFSDIKESLGLFYKIPVSFYKESYELSISTAKIAFDNKITYYDASFLALAQKFEAVLITDNPKHQKKTKQFEVKVISLKDY